MISKLKKELNNKKEITRCAKQFGLVGDPTRMKICWLLCKHKELSVGDIAEVLGVSVSVVSHSLKRLKNFELVESKRVGRQIFYNLTDSDLNIFIRSNFAIV